MSRISSLPVDALLPEIVASLQRHPCLVIEAQPGAGKTTRVPSALLSAVAGEILVLEPRRIAARLAARRVAWELGEAVGETVGYKVRFEEVTGPRTRLLFVTEGILTRRLLTDPGLAGVDVVVLDEFHERHLDSDLALALLRRLQRSRPELRIVIMSATLDAAPVARYLDQCPVLRSEGRMFPLELRHLPYSPEPLHIQVRGAVELLMLERHEGHVLVFLPGVAEIRRTMRECEAIARSRGLSLLPLHGELSPTEQDRAIESSQKQKLILATNVAESSVTVDGVTAVIDSGLARIASHSPWTGLPTLEIGRVSQASARQRAGRAGRTAPGRVLRLYPEEDYLRRQEHETPEIDRSDLSQLCLALRVLGTDDIYSIEWLDAPPQVAVRNAQLLLDRLGATGEMTYRLARYPLAPRLSRILVEAMKLGVGEDGCVAAALLGSGARLEKNDLLAAMDMPMDQRSAQHLQQLRKTARPPKQKQHDDDALLMSVLAGFPDRVARLRSGNQITLANGTMAEVVGEVPGYEFMVAVDAEDRKDRPNPLVRLTARIEPEWLIELFPERVHEQNRVTWNRVAERVEASSALLYDELTIQETRDVVPDAETATKLLAQKAIEAGIDRFVDRQTLDAFVARLEFARITPPDISFELVQLCSGLHSFAELKRAASHLLSLLEQKLDSGRLAQSAPVSIRLRGGRQVKVHYAHGKTPWIASRIQDFFGMPDTPLIGTDKTAVVVHLLAPNQRAVQTTTDLAGFWERLYPQVRRELMRRYPRHEWPEKP